MALPGRQLNRKGSLNSVSVAVCKNVYLDGYGRPLADVANAYGSVWIGCLIAIEGGGGAEDDAHNPPRPMPRLAPGELQVSAGSEVLLSFGPGPIPHPIVTGVLKHPRAAARMDDAGSAGREGLSARTGVHEAVSGAHGSRVVHTVDGNLGLDAARGGGAIKAQVGEDGAVRVAHTRYDADAVQYEETHPTTERLLLGRATVNYLDLQAAAKINELGARVVAIETILLGAIQGAIGATGPVGLKGDTLVGGLAAFASPGAWTPAVTAAGSGLLSAAFEVSTKREGEE